MLLHYQDQNAHIERDKVVKELEQHIKNYKKGMPGIYVIDGQESAKERAKKLREMHKNNNSKENR